jgi:glycosyltransferase involved in cell wall biosynthesis
MIDFKKNISVIIPVYNRTTPLLKAIESVLLQGELIKEIIVVDDASSDDVGETIRRLNLPKIRYFRNKKNKGAAYSRNFASQKALGEWIAFLDSDDFWYENKLKLQCEAIIETNASVCYCSVDTSNGKSLIAKYSGDILTPLLKYGNIVAGGFSSILIKKKDFLAIDGINERLCSRQDYEMHIRLSIKKTTYTCVEKPLLFFKTIGNDRITTNNRARIRGLLLVYKLYKDFFISTNSRKYIKDIEELLRRLNQLKKYKTAQKLGFYFLNEIKASPILYIKMLITLSKVSLLKNKLLQ